MYFGVLRLMDRQPPVDVASLAAPCRGLFDASMGPADEPPDFPRDSSRDSSRDSFRDSFRDFRMHRNITN